MKLVLVRHPAPDVPPGQCYGRLDVPLRADAVAALPDLAARIAAHRPARVWTSPATRCRRLAEAVATRVPLRVEPNLRELDFGAWEGQPWGSVPRADLERWAADPVAFAPPGGEAGHEFLARVGHVYRALRDAGEDAVAVSHGGPLKLLSAMCRGKPPDLLAPAPAFGSIMVFDV
jgi:alpha-ribazole phosphatase